MGVANVLLSQDYIFLGTHGHKKGFVSKINFSNQADVGFVFVDEILSLITLGRFQLDSIHPKRANFIRRRKIFKFSTELNCAKFGWFYIFLYVFPKIFFFFFFIINFFRTSTISEKEKKFIFLADASVQGQTPNL